MLPLSPQDIDHDKFMEWLQTSERRLCCKINTIATVYGQKICWDCYRSIRPTVTDICVNWEETSIKRVIKWEGHDT